MDRWLGKYSDLLYAIMRMVVGLLFACHGAQKLFGAFGGHSDLSDPWMLVGGIVEFFGGALVFLGLWTSYAAFLTSGQMAVAYFKAHASGGLWPIVNHGELAVIYCFVFLFMASRSAGRLSVDALLRRRRP